MVGDVATKTTVVPGGQRYKSIHSSHDTDTAGEGGLKHCA